MGQTPIYQFPYPELTDPADVPTDIRELADGVEDVLSGPFDSRLDALEAGIGSTVRLGDALLAAPAAQFDFTAIPQTYAHLLLAGYLRSTTAAFQEDLLLRYNGNTQPVYHTQIVNANAATVGAAESLSQTAQSAGTIPAASATAGLFSSALILIANYTAPTTHKSMMTVGGSATALATGGVRALLRAGVWGIGAPAPIDRVTLSCGLQFAAGSRISLYGLRGT